uniref:BHLH domain-containing protein n=1 Tax=Periophthalmus magnuspinnatus TaxID=409849 RepID=A0A3B3Z7H9_9GOBI
MEIKPVVEKLRRERINSSIEQLKSLLCAEFLQQQPDSKLEKADVLEMTVTVLTRLQHSTKTHTMSQSHMKSPQQSHREALFCLQSSTKFTEAHGHSASVERSCNMPHTCLSSLTEGELNILQCFSLGHMR